MRTHVPVIRWYHAVLLLMAIINSGTRGWGQETSPYPNGTSGLKAGTVPGPGHYYILYNYLYEADQTMDIHGDPATGPHGEPMGFDLTTFASVHRLIHVTDYKLLGAEYSWNIVLPVVDVDISIDAFGVDSQDTKIGDINIEPFVIEWKEPSYDFGYVVGMFAPTAERSASRPSLPGKGFFTGYVGAAGTYYFDEERTWTASFLSRYEMSGQRRDLDITPGDNFSFEWGVGKTIDQVLTMGVSGFASWQMTLDEGTDVTYANVRDHVFGVGPEVQYFSTKYKFGYQARVWWQFDARDRSEGTIATLTLVKPF